MATQIQNAKLVIDALLDSKGRAASDVALATKIVEQFTNTVGDAQLTNEQKAENFNSRLVRIIRSTMRAHVENATSKTYEDDIAAAGDAAEADL